MKYTVLPWALAVAFSLHCPPGAAQFAKGTAVIAISTGKIAVIAADSLETVNNQSSKHACKIRYAAPNYIAAVSGLGAEYEVDFAAIGARMLAIAKVATPSEIDVVALNWRNLIVQRFNEDLVTEPEVMRSLAKEPNQGTTIVLLAADSGHNILIREISVLLSIGANRRVAVTPGDIIRPEPSAFGGNTIVRMGSAADAYFKVDKEIKAGDKKLEGLEKSLNTSKSSAQLEQSANKYIDITASWFNDVGGKVDLMVLDASGAHWGLVKPECRADSLKAK